MEKPINWEKLHYDFKIMRQLENECWRTHPEMLKEHTKMIWEVYLSQWKVVDKLTNLQIMQLVEDYRTMERLHGKTN